MRPCPSNLPVDDAAEKHDGQKVAGVYHLVFRRAPDSVSQRPRMQKKGSFCIGGTALNLVSDLLEYVPSYLSVVNESSEGMGASSRMTRGSVLGPTPLLLYIKVLVAQSGLLCSSLWMTGRSRVTVIVKGWQQT